MSRQKKAPQKSTRKLPELNYIVRRFADYQNITDNKKTKEFVFMNLVNAIEEGLKTESIKVDLFKLRGSRSSIVLDRSNWKKSLNNAISFFSDIEYYETCSKCKELLNKI